MVLLMFCCYTGGLSAALVPRRLYTTKRKSETEVQLRKMGVK